MQIDADELAGPVGRDEPCDSLIGHDVDLVLANVLLEFGGQARTLGIRRRDQILDPERVEQLAAEAFGDDSGPQALSGGVDSGGCTGGSAPDDEHVEWILRRKPLGCAVGGTGVELAENLFEAHPTLIEALTVGEDGRHGHNSPGGDLVREQCAVDRHVLDVRIDDAHQVQGLHDVGAVLARQ